MKNPLKLLLLLCFTGLSALFVFGTKDTAVEKPGQDKTSAETQERRPNYIIPVVAGAIGGILLALWLRRKKG